ncbi:hypothetical protein LJK87_06195 [Paenibacillus sp. P25]|nr:hypothetical protein LJK87_06195 [Paenibacillus sp. P25]
MEDMIGEQLRTAAIATKMRLDPDIHKIDNSELVELKKIIGVDEITLFARQGDDIVGLKSSDPKEIGVSSKGWDTIFVAFNQLLSRQEVNVGIGQTLRDYWSGPRDTSTTNPAQVNKWGYYYDGTTNYIIDPFVSVTGFKQYQDVTGVDDAIHRLLRDNGEAALEVSVLNSDKLLQRKLPEINPTPSNWFSEREVLFGSYEYRDPEEKQYAEAALNEKPDCLLHHPFGRQVRHEKLQPRAYGLYEIQCRRFAAADRNHLGLRRDQSGAEEAAVANGRIHDPVYLSGAGDHGAHPLAV